MNELRQRRPGPVQAPEYNESSTPGSSSKSRKQVSAAFDFKLLLLTAIMYTSVLVITEQAFARVPTPLPTDASSLKFAEGRALKHTAYLASIIGDRQVSTQGEEEAAQYLLEQASHMAATARKHRPDLEVEVERQQVTGGVTMSAFKFEIANVYNNLTNIVIRISPKGSTAKGVLVNSHYDSTLGTVGASDDASCIGVMMELARTIIANQDVKLQSPVVFLFNGGEETLSQASNGFIQSSKYARDLGAFINLESTGPWGPDVVFQHTGDWTLQAYARSAPNPRGTTVAQDFFDLGLIPADTDYRMFSYRHYGNLPGIDIAFIGDGTAYHTARDEVGRIRPGTLQAMGENVLAAIQEYSRVLATNPKAPSAANKSGSVYFDVLGKFMIVYPHWLAKVLHNAPLVLILLLGTSSTGPVNFLSLLGSALVALCSILLGVLLPALVGGVRAYISRIPYIWYGKPLVAYSMYIPAALAGLMLPYLLSSWQGRIERAPAHALGFALLFSALSSGLTAVGMHSAFLYASWAAAAAAAVTMIRPSRGPSGQQLGLRNILILLALVVVPITVCMPTSLSITDHVMEKIGLAGAAPMPLGRWIGDAAVGAVAGIAALLALGTLTPFLVAGLGKSGRFVVVLLLASSVGAAVWSSKTQKVYSFEHPKRILVQHIHKHDTQGQVSESQFSFVQLDDYPVERAIHNSLHGGKAEYSNGDWESFYPLNILVTGLAREAPPPDTSLIPSPPSLKLLSRSILHPDGQGEGDVERLTLELDTHIGAWGVMNLTGDIRAWSLSDSVAGGPGNASSHMARYASNAASPKYIFWVELPKDFPLSIHLFVMYVPLTPEAVRLKNSISDLVSPAVVTTYQSQWVFGGPPAETTTTLTFTVGKDGKAVLTSEGSKKPSEVAPAPAPTQPADVAEEVADVAAALPADVQAEVAPAPAQQAEEPVEAADVAGAEEGAVAESATAGDSPDLIAAAVLGEDDSAKQAEQEGEVMEEVADGAGAVEDAEPEVGSEEDPMAQAVLN